MAVSVVMTMFANTSMVLNSVVTKVLCYIIVTYKINLSRTESTVQIQ